MPASGDIRLIEVSLGFGIRSHGWGGWVALAFQSRQSLHAEVLFLRRQLALYVERGVKPRRTDAATRVSLAWCRGSSSGAPRWS